MPKQKGQKGRKPSGSSGEKSQKNKKDNGVKPPPTIITSQQPPSNEIPLDRNTLNNKKSILKNQKKAFRVLVIFRKDVKYSNESILKTLKISSTGVSLISHLDDSVGAAVIYFKYRYAAEMALQYSGEEFYVLSQAKYTKIKFKINQPISNSNIIKYIEYFNSKQNPIITMNLVTSNGFWAIGLDNSFMEEEESEVLKHLKSINLNMTALKLRIPDCISNEYLMKAVKLEWNLDGKVSCRKNVTVFVVVDKTTLNEKITKGFYIGQTWIVNYSWHARQKYLKYKQKVETSEIISANNRQLKILEQSTDEVKKNIKHIKENAIFNKSNYTNELETIVNNLKNEVANLNTKTNNLDNNFFNIMVDVIQKYFSSETGRQFFDFLIKETSVCIRQ